MIKKKLIRILLLKETFLLITSLVFLWMTISLLVDQNYSLSSLKPNNGVLVKMDSVITKVKDKPFFKEVTKQLRLKISSSNEDFTLFSTNGFEEIASKLTIGDTVSIYTKPKVWGVFGMRKSSDINHLTKGDQIIVDYSNYKRTIGGVFMIPLIGFLGFFIGYIVRVRHRLYWEFGGYKKYVD